MRYADSSRALRPVSSIVPGTPALRAMVMTCVVLCALVVPRPARAQVWTWTGGHYSTWRAPAHYGTMFMTDTANLPPARWGAATWTVAGRYLWLYGGTEESCPWVPRGDYSDLWMYDVQNRMWTWMGGRQELSVRPHYGQLNCFDSSSHPGARICAGAWSGPDSSMWLFGGEVDNGMMSYVDDALYNDLWKYHPRRGQWAWVGGPDTLFGRGNYGVKNVPSRSNWPRARKGMMVVSDSVGNAFVFGGQGGPRSDSLGLYNDLWKFDRQTGEWVWYSGTAGQCNGANGLGLGVYGVKGIASLQNVPGARYGGAMWLDRQGRIWLYGGYGNGRTGLQDSLSDLWCFDTTARSWTWITGSDTAGLPITGIIGVQSASNTPGSRTFPSFWLGDDDHLWLFGGSLRNYFTYGRNDVWSFDLNTSVWTCMRDQSAWNYGIKGVKSNSNVPYHRSGGSSWKTSRDTVWLYGGACDQGGAINDQWELNYLQSWPVDLAAFSGHFIDGRVTLHWTTASERNCAYYRIERCEPGVADAWIVRSTVPGSGTTTVARNYDFTELAPADARLLRYRLWQRDYDGTEELLGTVDIAADPVPLTTTLSSPYPNPASDRASLQWTIPTESKVTIRVTDMLGRELLRPADGLDLQPGTHTCRADISNLVPGGYFLVLHAGGSMKVRRFTVAR